MKKMFKNQLDEMQEQRVLKIEHIAVYYAYIALFVAIMFQNACGRVGDTIGEWCAFGPMSVLLVAGSIKNGVWDRYLKPKTSTNFILSLLAGFIIAVFQIVVLEMKMPTSELTATEHIVMLAVTAGIVGAIIAIICFVVLELCLVIYKKRIKKIEGENSDEEK